MPGYWNPLMRFFFRRAVAASCVGLAIAWPSFATPRADLRQPVSPSLDAVVLKQALEAVECAQQRGYPVAQRLGVIDFRLPSSQKRLWVLDLASGDILFHEHVAHGRGSGDGMASRFSNVTDSFTSSLGLFQTLNSYNGANGYSLRLAGLEPGINDRALERAIVMHGADYVSEGFIKTSGRLGRSYGCPAVRREVAQPLIDTLREGQYLYAYAEDAAWRGTAASLGCGKAPLPLQAAAGS